MKDIWYVARRICAVIVGTVLFVAGSLKLMDPVGAGLVVSEYFKFFHLYFIFIFHLQIWSYQFSFNSS